MSVRRKLGPILLKRGFAKIRDEQGLIDVDGAKKLIQAHLVPLNHPYVVAKFDELAGGNILKFNYEEFYDLFKDIRKHTKDGNEVIAMFKTYDVDGNGYIEREDLKKCLREDEYYQEDELDTVIDMVMSFGDVNEDGRLNYLEFVELIRDQDIL